MMKPLALVKHGLADYRAQWKRYLLLTAIVAVPVNLIALSSALGADATIGFYTELASLFMTSALLWAVARRSELVGLAVRRSYYEGSSILLRLILAVAMLALLMIPAAIGLTLYSLGTAAGSGATLGVQLLLGGLVVVFALPSLMWLVRFGFVAFAVVDGSYPIEAFKKSRELSLGRFWPTTGRILGLFLFMVLLVLPGAIITIVIALTTHWTGVDQLLQLYISLYVIPVALLSYHHLYRQLEGAKA